MAISGAPGVDLSRSAVRIIAPFYRREIIAIRAAVSGAGEDFRNRWLEIKPGLSRPTESYSCDATLFGPRSGTFRSAARTAAARVSSVNGFLTRVSWPRDSANRDISA